MSTNPVMQDKELMDDCLTSQKYITDGYNTFANECCKRAASADGNAASQ